jgi:hypothetical protein
MSRVLKFEEDQGRNPIPMPPTNKGYDVESRDRETNELLRYIEVKSVSGAWDDLGVGLSESQFEKATQERTRYWLYVVERAEQTDFDIIRIQDPAAKVDTFLFDDGWRDVGEGADDDRDPS